MFAALERLENRYQALLPVQRLTEAPGKELMEAARAWSEEVWNMSRILGPLPLSEEQLNHGLKLAQRPVFICGVHRSGTTLVRDLLDAHPALVVLPAEGSFLTNLAAPLKRMSREHGEFFLATEWLRRLANPINQPPYWVLGRSTAASSAYVQFARAFASWYTIMEGRFKSRTSFWPHLGIVLAYATVYKEAGAGLASKYWVEKTPANERYLQQIWQDLPEAKIIHLVRAPMDVFLSRKRMEPSLNLKKCLKDLAKSYKIAGKQASLNPSKYLLVHYEELCKNPEPVLTGMTDFLEIEQHASLFTPTVGGQAAQPNSSFNLHLPAGGILASQANLHTGRDLQSQEGKLLSAFLFKSASQLGYSLYPIAKPSAWLLRLKLHLESWMP